MDIAIVGQNSLRIRAKNATFIVNPDKKIDEDIVIFTKPPQDYSIFGDKIVIAGPGEYESSGVSIKGEASPEGTSFNFYEEGQKLMVFSSPAAAQKIDIEDASAVVAYLDPAYSDKVAEITADLVAVIGPEEYLPVDKSNIKKVDKINLKKTDEFKGFIVHLSK